jgi:anti-anti-sigma regulatory factor
MTATSRPPLPLPVPPPAPFLLSIDVAAGSVSVHGELDYRHVERLLDAVGVLKYSRSPVWTIDAAGLLFCDASGLRALLAARQLAQEAGRILRVTRPGSLLRHLLQAIEFDARPPAPSLHAAS